MGWAILASLSLVLTLARAAQWKSRGREEALISQYGANDDAILLLSRRWFHKVMIWAFADALVFLGIWAIRGVIPWWSVALGAVAIPLGLLVGIRIWGSLVPSGILELLAGGILMLLMMSALAFQSQLEALAHEIAWVTGAMTPTGWAVLMIKDVIQGHWQLLIVLPLLGVGLWVSRSMVLSAEKRMLEEVLKPISDTAEENSLKTQNPEESWETMVEAYRKDLPELPTIRRQTLRMAIWTAVILLLTAAGCRFTIFFSDRISYLLLIGTIVFAYAIWLPLSGVPLWLQDCQVSVNRIAGFFTLHPLSLREVLRKQMNHELKTIWQPAAFLFVLMSTVFVIALPIPVTSGLALGAILTFCALLAVPIRWSYLATRVHRIVPFGIHTAAIVGMLTIIGLTLCAEVVVFITMTMGAITNNTSWIPAGVLAALATLNALLGLLALRVGLHAHERRRWDLIRIPPRNT